MTLWGKWNVSFCSIKNYLASHLFQACYHNYQHHDICFCQFLDLHCSQWRHLHQVALNFRPVVYTMTQTQKNTPWNNQISKRFSETAHPPTFNLTSPLNFHWGPNICCIRGGVCGHLPRILRWFKQPIWLLTFPISSVHATVCWAGISRPSTHLLNKLLWMKMTADELAQLLVIFNLA